MIVVRRLIDADSTMCMALKLERLKLINEDIFEIRKNNFFNLYKVYSDKYWSYGAFDGENLVGMCSFIEIDSSEHTFFVTDLLVSEGRKQSLVPAKMFRFIYNDILSSLKDFKVVAIEEKFMNLEFLKKYLAIYRLRPLPDQIVYTALVATGEKNADKLLLNPVNHALDTKAQSMIYNGEELTLFTDEDYRVYSYNKKIIKRLYLSGYSQDLLNDSSFCDLICKILSDESFQRFDYLVILAHEKPMFKCDYLYLNRLMTFSTNPTSSTLFDIKKGILI